MPYPAGGTEGRKSISIYSSKNQIGYLDRCAPPLPMQAPNFRHFLMQAPKFRHFLMQTSKPHKNLMRASRVGCFLMRYAKGFCAPDAGVYYTQNLMQASRNALFLLRPSKKSYFYSLSDATV